MKAFFRKYAVRIFFFAIIALFFIGLLNYVLHKNFGLGCTPDPFPDTEVVVDDWSKPLQESGYKPATVTKPDFIPGDKFPESVEAVIYAEGSAGEDEVVISIVETPEGTVWVKAEINGNEVKWRKVEYAQMGKDIHDSDWSLLACGQFSDGIDFAAGCSYEPFQFLGARAGLSAIVDINRDIGTSPDWIAINARLSRRMGIFSVGADCGYSMGDRRGLAVGVSVGVALGI